MGLEINILIILITGLIFSGFISIISIIELCRHADRLGVIDQPGHRKVHKKPIARIGGLGIIIGFFAGIFYFDVAAGSFDAALSDFISPSPFLLTGAIVIALTGLVDDLRGLNFRQKLVVQSLVASYIIMTGARLHLDFGIYPGYAEFFSIPLTFFWIIGVTNAVNLIDGLDGLAGGVFTISLFTITFCTMAIGESMQIVVVFSIVGAVLGFLILNWHPAKVFMGDSGSLFLGYIVAVYSLQATNDPANSFVFMIPIFAVGLPVFDTLLSMGRRALKGRPLFYPDKDHIHHRIQEVFGLSQRQTVYALYLINMVFGAVAIALCLVGNVSGFFITLIGLAFLVFLLFRLKYLSFSKIRNLIKPRKSKLKGSNGYLLPLK